MQSAARVLLVGKRDESLAETGNLLRRQDYDVITAGSKQEAVMALELQPPPELMLVAAAKGCAEHTADAAEAVLERRELPLLIYAPTADLANLRRLCRLPRYGLVPREAGEELLADSIDSALHLYRCQSERPENARSYQLLFDTTADAVFMIDEETNTIIEANRSAEKIYGYSREELIGKPVLELSAEPEGTRQTIADIAPHQQLSLYRVHRRRDGSHFPVHISGTRTRSNGQPINIATVRDITEYRRLQQELSEQQRKYAEVIDTVPSAIIEYDNDQKIRFFNSYAEKMFGFTADEVIGKVATATTNPPVDSGGMDHREMFVRILNDPERYGYHENENIRRDGSRIWVAWRNVSVYDAQGNRRGMLSVGNDITAYKRSREQLEASRNRYRTIFNEAPIGIVTVERDGTILTANPFFCRWLGYRLDELTGVNTHTITHADDWPREVEEMHRLKSGEVDHVRMEKRYLRRDGSVVWGYLVTKSATWQAEETAYGLGMVIDITQYKKSEQERQHLLEEKEMLLHEVHHRIKNDMHVIGSLLSLQAAESKTPGESAALEEARNRVHLMRSIYDRLYTGEDFRSLEISLFLGDLLNELQGSYALTGAVTLRKELAELEVPVRISFPLGIIVNELVTNAYKYAFPDDEKGEIQVTLTRRETESGSQLELIVTDNGIGIPEEIAAGRPMGFGLQIVDTMVRQHQGRWDIERDKGTRHRLLLPMNE